VCLSVPLDLQSFLQNADIVAIRKTPRQSDTPGVGAIFADFDSLPLNF
jgi:hypothetical protein